MNRRTAALAVVATASVAAAVAGTAHAVTPLGFVVLYEGANATQNIVCSIALPRTGPIPQRQIDFTSNPYGCDNDEARSLAFVNLSAGVAVQAWDRSSCANPVGQKPSDFAVIDLAEFASRTRVDTFEANTGQVRGLPYIETYHRATGDLDGKVSCLKVSRAR